MRRSLATVIYGAKDTRQPVARIVLPRRSGNLVCHLRATFLVQACADVFRYVLTIFRLQDLADMNLTSVVHAHSATLHNIAEHVNTYNFGSEGWGFESLQARV